MTCFPTMKDLLSYALMLLPAGLSAQGIYITPGAQLVMNGPLQLILNNAGISNNGKFAAGTSTVWLTGNDTTHSMQGTRNTGLNATLRIHYLDAELAGINEPKLTMYKGSDLTSGYLPAGRDSIDTINNVVVKSGIDNLNRFTLGSDSLTGDAPILVTNPVARQAVKPEDLNENLSDKIQVFPVPARDYFILTVSGERKQRIEYFLFNEAGHLLQSKKVLMLPGSNSISWDISSYPAGMYYLTAGNSKMQKIRILKQ